MRVPIDSFAQLLESDDFGLEMQQIFDEMGSPAGSEELSSRCSPPIDLYETDDTIELAMDLPGVAASTLRLVVKGAAVLVAGKKLPHRTQEHPSFHVAEREYGRFARTVKLAAAVDARRARATLTRGELRLTLPKLVERRGVAIQVPVSTNSTVG
jgi:HSP20 family protein